MLVNLFSEGQVESYPSWQCSAQHATFSSVVFIIKHCSMQYQSEQLYPSLPSVAQSLQKHSLNTTFMHSSQDSQTLPLSNHHHNHPYAHYSHNHHLDTHIPFAEQYIVELTQRLSQIALLFVHHSEKESEGMEKRAGLKVMPIESTQLPPDFSNKMSIIEDMTHLISRLEEDNNSQHLRELLETKFEQYYLERHYGGLNCEFNNLSIQDRHEQETNSISSNNHSKNQGNSINNQSHSGYLCANSNVNSNIADHQPASAIGISNINYVSLVNESKITYSEDFCQTGEDYQYNIEIPRIIEVQIPVVIYKIKEIVISYDQNDLISQFNNIDDIINRYSQPYEDLYQGKGEMTTNVETWKKQEKIQNIDFWKFQKEPQKEESSMPLSSNIQPIGSIMLDSNMNYLQKETQIELSYSDFPEQPTFKLPLDSYAQLQSLISNEQHLTDRTSNSPNDRDHLSSQTILITEKVSSSIIEKYQEIEKQLMEENQEIKQALQVLQQKFAGLQKKNKDLETQNNRLVRRLQEQIEQSAYFQKKLQESDAEILQERVQCLTHLSEAKERKIEHLIEEVSQKTQDISYLQKELEDMNTSLEKTQQQLHKREQELAVLTKQLQDNENELQELNKCEEDIMMIAGESELNLKRQIEILQIQKADLKEKVKDYEKRLQSEGISLQYDEAKEIQGIIEEQEHVYSIELQQVTKKYEEIIQGYQKQIEDLKIDLKEMQALKNIAKEDAEDIRKQTRQQLKETKISNSMNESYLGELQEIIKEYDHELQIKDEEILKLKNMLNQKHFKKIIERSSKAIELLEGQLKRQRQQKTGLTFKLIEIDVLIKKQISNQQTKKYNQDQTKLIQQLSTQLDKKSHEITHLQEKLLEKDNLILLTQQKQVKQMSSQYHAENIRLHKINAKLKRYTTELQHQIRSLSAIDECEYHSNLLNRITQQRNYLLGLASP